LSLSTSLLPSSVSHPLAAFAAGGLGSVSAPSAPGLSEAAACADHEGPNGPYTPPSFSPPPSSGYANHPAPPLTIPPRSAFARSPADSSRCPTARSALGAAAGYPLFFRRHTTDMPDFCSSGRKKPWRLARPTSAWRVDMPLPCAPDHASASWRTGASCQFSRAVELKLEEEATSAENRRALFAPPFVRSSLLGTKKPPPCALVRLEDPSHDFRAILCTRFHRCCYSESRFYSLAGRTFFGLFGALFVSAFKYLLSQPSSWRSSSSAGLLLSPSPLRLLTCFLQCFYVSCTLLFLIYMFSNSTHRSTTSFERNASFAAWQVRLE